MQDVRDAIQASMLQHTIRTPHTLYFTIVLQRKVMQNLQLHMPHENSVYTVAAGVVHTANTKQDYCFINSTSCSYYFVLDAQLNVVLYALNDCVYNMQHEYVAELWSHDKVASLRVLAADM